MHAAMPLMPNRLRCATLAALHGVGRRLRHGERGQNLVELALVVPMLAVFLFALAEFGNMFRVQIELDNAVRDGARYAALNPSATWSTVYSNKIQPETSDLSGVSGTVTQPTTCSTSPTTSEVTVTASYSYSTITPVGGLLRLYGGNLNSPDTLTSKSEMLSEC